MPQTKAIITRPGGPEGPTSFEPVKLSVREPKDGELLVKIVASGICHTDLSVANVTPTPRIFGHEGAGIVQSVGGGVTVAKKGDFVLLSFAHCETCRECKLGHPAYCKAMSALNGYGGQGVFEDEAGRDVQGGFFGQSSFAELTIVLASCVVNVTGVVGGEEELGLFAPLGCGFQTGAGAIVNECSATEEDMVLVTGLGGVGMAAIMAAKIAGCKVIIGIDRVQTRLELAKELGATAVIDNSDAEVDIKAEVQRLTEGHGASIVIEATGRIEVLKMAWGLAGQRGRVVIVGMPDYTATLDVHVLTMLSTGRVLMACVEGDSVPCEFVPRMIEWYRQGRFPIDKLVRYFKADDYQAALDDMKSGKCIKPVLLW